MEATSTTILSTTPLFPSLLILTQRDGLASSCTSFGEIIHRLITKGCSLSFSHTGILHWFCSRKVQEKSWLSLRIFGCRSHSCSGLCACVFHTSFGGRCMYPCRLWPCMLSIVVCFYVFPCPCWEFSFFPICGLCNVAIVSL